jgi:hypothetical protein
LMKLKDLLAAVQDSPLTPQKREELVSIRSTLRTLESKLDTAVPRIERVV